MAQEKILGNQLNLTDVAQGLSPYMITEVVDDTSPQLGGNLDVNTFNIVSTNVTTNTNADNITLQGGSASYVGGSTYAGQVHLRGGNASNNNTAGYMSMYGGDSTGGGYGGWIDIIAGSTDTGWAGWLNLYGGPAQAAGGNAGWVTIRGGNGGNTNAAGVLIRGGDNNVGAFLGGDIDLVPGYSATGTDGNVRLHAPNTQIGTASLQFWNDTDIGHTAGNYVAIQAPAATSNQTLTLPEVTGTLMANVVEDTTPQLGGNLSVNGYKIGNSPVGSPHNPTAYLEFVGETVNLFSGATNSTVWDSTVAILSSTDGTTGEYGVQTVTLQGQNRFGTTGPYGAGGDVVIKGGDTTGSPNTNLHGGDATLSAGSGFNNTGSFITVGGNGSITLQQAANTTGNAGSISLIGANGGTGSGAGADIVLYAGNGTDTNGAGGDITLRPGRGVGIGADGLVAINNPSGSTTEQSKLRFFEAATNGTNYVELVAQASIGTSVTWTLPAEQNTVGDPLGIDLGEYTVGTLPTASSYPNCWALVTDAAAGSPYVGRVTVRSDGTNWKMIAPEGATVS